MSPKFLPLDPAPVIRSIRRWLVPSRAVTLAGLRCSARLSFRARE